MRRSVFRLPAGMVVLALVSASAPVLGQTAPVGGIRPADLRAHAITNATVITSPGQKIENATIIIRDGVIEAVGANVAVPPEARVWDAAGKMVYPGLIDPAVLISAAAVASGPGAHWNPRVVPQVNMARQPGPTPDQRKELRSIGFTVAAVYPSAGVFRGSGVVIALAEEDKHMLAYRAAAGNGAAGDSLAGLAAPIEEAAVRAAMAMAFEYGGRRGEGGARSAPGAYPGSLMGAIALIRQTLFDAQWHDECRRVWRDHPQGNEPPIRADALEALADAVAGRQPVLFEVADELNALRAAKIIEEFSLKGMLLGSGLEFRRLGEIAATKLPVIVTLRYPDLPKVASLVDADRLSVRDLMTWEQAPTNPRRLIEAGVTIALTTHRLKKPGDFPAAVQEAIKHGLTEEAALAAVTITPAALLGMDHVLGTIAPGKAANLVVADGPLFAKKTKVLDTWVNGRRHEVTAEPKIALAGTFVLKIDGRAPMPVTLDTEKKTVSITPSDEGAKPLKARDVSVQQERLSFVIDGALLGQTGAIRMTGVISQGAVSGFGVSADGARFDCVMEPAAQENEDAKPPAEAAPAPGKDDRGQKDEKAEKEEEAPFEMPPADLVFPLGEYGFAEPPPQGNFVIKGATIWTCGPQGVIENGVLYHGGGKIGFVGTREQWSGFVAITKFRPDPREVVLHGRHITPGLIDCHSHTGISGGVNEFSQANTAEVRIGDVIDPDDINWYRQLAGGLTAANQLHGSANPIGGQNSVVKIRWGGGAADYPIADAIAGIKFALGENVIRPDGRYPKTRMGVETYIRDAFTAAREYRAQHERHRALPAAEKARTMPPRRDLELDALAEILGGSRLVHCHSYRQDEILMLIRVADDFAFRIGTFQHVLEGFKVAEAIARHGAGASSFSDWWGYKIEVMDAIPHNGAILHDVGAVVSFNSDSSELARRMNTEAAKAVRYGGVDPHEALKFVTINPAKQLRIDQRAGSLEVGKDADFVVWSDDPLSTYARCEQTWVESAPLFTIERDRELRAEAAAQRERLVQKILARSKPQRAAPGSAGRDSAEEKPDEPGQPPPPTRLMARLHQQWLAWMEEQVARGRNPDDLMPGDCGCGHASMWEHIRQME